MSSHNKLCKAVLQLPNSPAHGHKLSLSYAKQQDEPRMALFEVPGVLAGQAVAYRS
jgi:hypothetical protein